MLNTQRLWNLVFFIAFFAVGWYCEEVTMRLPSACSTQVSSTLPLVSMATNSANFHCERVKAQELRLTGLFPCHFKTIFKTGVPIKTADFYGCTCSIQKRLTSNSLPLPSTISVASTFDCSLQWKRLTSQHRWPCGSRHSHVGRNDSALQHEAAWAGLHFTPAPTETTVLWCQVTPAWLRNNNKKKRYFFAPSHWGLQVGSRDHSTTRWFPRLLWESDLVHFLF